MVQLHGHGPWVANAALIVIVCAVVQAPDTQLPHLPVLTLMQVPLVTESRHCNRQYNMQCNRLYITPHRHMPHLPVLLAAT